MTEKKPRPNMIFLYYALLFALGLLLIFWSYGTICSAIDQMQQFPVPSINYSPAFGIMGMGVVIICIGPIHYFCQQRTK